ncbi:hypothetical protein CUMW_207240 [Citrus unshiu]|uniref:1-acylglycerol-3-phosphate O-acyltransferase n=2 Tax=Citrus TaxID=2706 RepID=A0A2H5Q984_CITUN|nr:hypothetical protein CUMW_207240 [Citrus unshiu]
MAIAAAAVIVPLGLLFFISGLVVNLIQAVCFVTIRPLSKNTYRRINRWVAELLWLELVWIVDWWAGVKIKLFVDREMYRLMGKEHALVVSNHKSDIDWLVGWVLAQRSGCLGSTLAVMKKSSKFLPVIGWSMWFSEYLFLERNWAKDESTLKSGLQRLRDYPQPFWLALFVEGTRFTQAKLLAAQEYAASTGLPIPRNVLIPRTKGFVSAVSHMRSFVPAIYDVTVAIPKSSPAPTMIRLFKGQSSVMHVHLKRHLMKELPETDDAVAQWCRDMFVAKVSIIEIVQIPSGMAVFVLFYTASILLLRVPKSYHLLGLVSFIFSLPDFFARRMHFWTNIMQKTHLVTKSCRKFPGQKNHFWSVVISWASLVIFGVLKFLQWSSLLSSWKGIAFSAFGLGIVTVLMQILIRFSQSERSTPAKVVPSKPKNSKEPEQTTQDKQR